MPTEYKDIKRIECATDILLSATLIERQLGISTASNRIGYKKVGGAMLWFPGSSNLEDENQVVFVGANRVLSASSRLLWDGADFAAYGNITATGQLQGGTLATASNASIGSNLSVSGSITLGTLSASSEINRVDNAGRLILASGIANNSVNGAILRMEGANYGGVGLGGNVQLTAPNVAKLFTVNMAQAVLGSLNVSGDANIQSNVFSSLSNGGFWIGSPGTYNYGMWRNGPSLNFRSGGSSTNWLSITSAGSSTFSGPVVMASTLNVSGSMSMVGGASILGRVSIGGSIPTSTGFEVTGNVISTGTTQIGIRAQPTFASTSTTAGKALYAQLNTAASSFAMTQGIGIQIDSPSIGSGSSVTTAYGLKIENQTAGSTNYSLFTGTGNVSLGGPVLLGSSLNVSGATYFGGSVNLGSSLNVPGTLSGSVANFSSSSIFQGSLEIAGHLGLGSGGAVGSAGINANYSMNGSTLQQGLLLNATCDSAATAGFHGISVNYAVPNSSFSSAGVAGLAINTMTKGAAAAVLYNYGVFVAAQSAASVNYAIYTDGGTQSYFGGRLNLNAGIYFQAGSTLDHYTEDTWTGTITGMTTTVTFTARYVRIGKIVNLYLPAANGTSNDTGMTITGMPVAIRPARAIDAIPGFVGNNGSIEFGSYGIATSGVITVYRLACLAAPGAIQPVSFDAAGTKGIQYVTLTYNIT